MENQEIRIQENIQMISNQLRLKISNRGEIDLQGEIKSDDLQNILDAAHLKNQIYLNHQQYLDRENNLMVLYIGLIFTILIGLISYCLMNQIPKNQIQQSLGATHYDG
jgi:hypothetical protein